MRKGYQWDDKDHCIHITYTVLWPYFLESRYTLIRDVFFGGYLMGKAIICCTTHRLCK